MYERRCYSEACLGGTLGRSCRVAIWYSEPATIRGGYENLEHVSQRLSEMVPAASACEAKILVMRWAIECGLCLTELGDYPTAKCSNRPLFVPTACLCHSLWVTRRNLFVSLWVHKRGQSTVVGGRGLRHSPWQNRVDYPTPIWLWLCVAFIGSPLVIWGAGVGRCLQTPLEVVSPEYDKVDLTRRSDSHTRWSYTAQTRDNHRILLDRVGLSAACLLACLRA